MTAAASDRSLAKLDEDRHDVMKLMVELEGIGAANLTSLDLGSRDITYERWEALGRYLGSVDRASRWWIGDWLMFGEEVFGEESAQGVEATTQERYSEAERVTGLEHSTLMNIRSICNRVPRPNRNKNLGFWIHAEVTALDPREQHKWLAQAETSGWTRSELRRAIRGDELDAGDDDDDGGGREGESIAERVERAARGVLTNAQPAGDGFHHVPDDAIAALRAAFGEV